MKLIKNKHFIDKNLTNEDISFVPLPHQIKTANKVINDLNGRAILADEVGLGKTIEAGLILKEYIKRGEIDKLLILVPASLGFQWINEMIHKFNMKNIWFNRKARGRGWEYFDYQIVSLDKAKREEHAKYLRNINFDMVIVDEAHKLKNRNTLNWKFVNSLKKKYCLLLTATPIHNDLKELYNLISILYPDLYNCFKDFKEKYKAKEYLVKNSDNLKNDLNQVMIRNHQKDTILNFSKRNIKQIFVKLSYEEKKLYNMVTNYVKYEYEKRKNSNKSILNLLTYQRELCSSFYALKSTLSKKEHLSPALQKIYNSIQMFNISSKLKKTGEILKENQCQTIIFTEYRATQRYIANYLNDLGYDVILFNGSFSSNNKEYIKNIFQEKKDIMISTEAGSQGLNLQFCNVMINYDLPWNPMKIEQRIGRIHRLGQTKDVIIYNLATKNTIEEKILKILYKKIFLFKDVIGDMQNILLEKDSSFESDIMHILNKSSTEKEMERKIDNLFSQKVSS
ncbi:MAG: DEAD/DEAH box helicase [bacterium]